MSEDWRLQGQERYLQGATLRRKAWLGSNESWDHDHCAFCGSKFVERPGDLREGYATVDEYHWICASCFSSFRDRFEWKVEEGPNNQRRQDSG